MPFLKSLDNAGGAGVARHRRVSELKDEIPQGGDEPGPEPWTIIGLPESSAPCLRDHVKRRTQDQGLELKPAPPEAKSFVSASVVLQRLHDEAPSDHFTLGWLMGSLRTRSFGIIMLLLGVVAIAPGISIVAGLLLMIPAFQMIAGRHAPVFPRRIADHPLPTRHLAALVQRAVPVLRYFEKIVHPRWHTPINATKRLVGIVVVILSMTVVLAPIPLSNVVPAVVIVMIALAYVEEDGLALSIALLAAVIVLSVASVAVWQMVLGAKWIGGLW